MSIQGLEDVAELLSGHLMDPLPSSEFPAAMSHWLHGSPVLGRNPSFEELESAAQTWLGTSRQIAELAHGLGAHPPFPPPESRKFTFIDLFAGIGGFRLALQDNGGGCIFSSEWDAAAKTTYTANFGEIPFGDIRRFTSDAVSDEMLSRMIPDHDVLTAGFPCQPFSRAGVSARRSLGQKDGFACEAQGTLFFDLLRIVKVKHPKVLILENVKNLASHDEKRTMGVIRDQIEALEYSFSPQLLNANAFLPQNRARYFMVCIANSKTPYSFPLDLFRAGRHQLRSILEDSPAEELTISDRLWEGHKNRTKRNLARGTGFTAHLANLDRPANTLVARYGKDGKECLIPQGDDKNPRMLSPRECARLQGFPDEFVLPAFRAAAYRQFGNSVAVPVVKALARDVLTYAKLI